MRFYYYITYKVTITFEEDDELCGETIDAGSEIVLEYPITSMKVLDDIIEVLKEKINIQDDFKNATIENILITNWILFKSEQFMINN